MKLEKCEYDLRKQKYQIEELQIIKLTNSVSFFLKIISEFYC